MSYDVYNYTESCWDITNSVSGKTISLISGMTIRKNSTIVMSVRYDNYSNQDCLIEYSPTTNVGQHITCIDMRFEAITLTCQARLYKIKLNKNPSFFSLF